MKRSFCASPRFYKYLRKRYNVQGELAGPAVSPLITTSAHVILLNKPYYPYTQTCSLFQCVLPSESCISIVSLLFLYGMNCCSLDRAEITSPRALRLLLMDWASCETKTRNDINEQSATKWWRVIWIMPETGRMTHFATLESNWRKTQPLNCKKKKNKQNELEWSLKQHEWVRLIKEVAWRFIYLIHSKVFERIRGKWSHLKLFSGCTSFISTFRACQVYQTYLKQNTQNLMLTINPVSYRPTESAYFS